MKRTTISADDNFDVANIAETAPQPATDIRSAKPRKPIKAIYVCRSEIGVSYPAPWEPLKWYSALEAIENGDGSVIARYIRHAKPDKRFIRELVKLLSPASNHYRKLHVCHRYMGKPNRTTTALKSCADTDLASMTKTIAETMSIDATFRADLANMFDPDSDHELFLKFRTPKKRGRPPLNQAKLSALRGGPSTPINPLTSEILSADDGQEKLVVIEEQLKGRASRSTIYRHRQLAGISRKRNENVTPLQRLKTRSRIR